MNEENLDLVKTEFDQDRKLWTDIRLQRIFAYSDLKIRLAEREFQFVLFLTTILITFLTLIMPLILDSGYGIPNFVIFSFLISSVLGLVRIILSIIIDKKEIPKDEKFELDYFQKCQKLAVEIYDNSLNNIINKNKITEYFNLGKNANDLASARENEKRLFNKILFIIYCLFLFSFVIGFISLFLWFFQ